MNACHRIRSFVTISLSLTAIGWFVCFGSSLGTLGVEPPQPELAELARSLEELTKGLDSNKLNERDKAEAKIIELGPRVIDLLPPVSDDISGESQMRIDRIRSVLEKRENFDLSKPSLVTLRGSMTGREAIEKISDATKNKIKLGENPELNKTVLTEFEETPYWEALDEILDQMGLTIPAEDGMEMDLATRVTSAPLRIESSSYAGVFRMVPLMVSKNSDLQNPDNNYLSISLLFAWEPRIEPSLLTLLPNTMKIVCDNGETLQPKSQEPIEFSAAAGCQTVVNLELALPSREATKIKSLSGELEAIVPGRMASIAFTSLDSTIDKTLTNGMLSVTLEKTRKNRKVHEILLGIAVKDTEEVTSSINAWSSIQDAYLFDKQLNRIEHVGWSTTRMGDRDYGLSYLFDHQPGLEGCRFVFRGPGSLHRGKVEFEIAEIELP
jgi:hypothetical protein